MNKMNTSLLIILVLIDSCFCSNFVFFHNFGTKSHLIQMSPLVEELLERHHTVTAISYGTIEVNHTNYTEILLPKSSAFVNKFYLDQSQRILSNKGDSFLSPSFWIFLFKTLSEGIETMAEEVYKLKQVQYPEEEKFDAIICHYSAICAPLAQLFDCPIIVFNPAGVAGYNLEGTGNIPNYSVQPYFVAPFLEPLTFSQRLQNHLLHKIFLSSTYWTSGKFEQHQEKYLGRQLRPVSEILKEKVSIVLSCSHFITHGSSPYLPNVIQVGGLQLKEAKQLPKDLKMFMDSAVGGVIFVSFGSTISSDKIPNDKLERFVECFRRLEQEGLSVIWKRDKVIPNLSSNVKLVSWVPQQDLLGHPNLQVFVTHGGLGSLVEAIYHKAVIVGVPLFTDQKPNIARAIKKGYATSLDWDNFTTEDMVTCIIKAIKDDKMKAKLEEVHSLFVDREEPPRTKAAWWVEYVVRHRGAEFLKNGAEEVPWYQFHHVDIVIFLVFMSVIALLVIFLGCKYLYKFVFSTYLFLQSRYYFYQQKNEEHTK